MEKSAVEEGWVGGGGMCGGWGWGAASVGVWVRLIKKAGGSGREPGEEKRCHWNHTEAAFDRLATYQSWTAN